MSFVNLARSSASVAVLAAVACTGAAYAQDEGGPTVDAIIVTAQKREQNLQDVPIVVTAVSEQLIRDAGVRDIKDLTVLTPGLMVTSTSNETVTSARIRGVGTVGDNPGLESSVGVVIDGVYRPRNGVGFGDLGDMERIEVLKGPQGTLFGKNTSSGVINIITKAPLFELDAESEVTIGNFNAVGFSNSITGPITDTLAGRLYIAARKRDGFQDIYTGNGPRGRDEDNNQHYYTARGQLLWRASENLDLRLIADYSKRDEDCCVGVQIANGPLAAVTNGVAVATGVGILAQPNPDERLGFANRSTAQEIEDKGISLQADWDFGAMSLTSITAARKWSTVNGQDSDFTALDLLYRPDDGRFFRDFSQFSQELRLAGEGDRFNWLVGAFYAKEDLDSGEPLAVGTHLELYIDQLLRATATSGSGVQTGGLAYITGDAFGTNYVPGVGQEDRYAQEGQSWALFANGGFDITDSLELTAGLRYTSEEKDLVSSHRNLNGGAGGAGFGGTNPCTDPATLGRALSGGATAAQLYVGYYCAGAQDPVYTNLDYSQSLEEEEVTGTVKLAWRVNDDLMTYASYARGYKAGGFNLDRVRIPSPANPSGVATPNLNTSFAPELVDSYELGAKTEWLDNSLLLNATLFYQQYENYQLNAFDGIAFTVTSIPEVVSRGVDADFLWYTPLDGFSLQGGVTYAETQYDDERPSGVNFQLPSGGLRRLPGTKISFAPLWSSSLSVAYERDIGEYVFRASTSAKYTSAYNTGSDLATNKLQDELVLVNGRLALQPADEQWAVELWGQNLTDETYLQVGYDATFQPGQTNGFLGAPRTFGATVRLRY